jgi:hypothetical protein
MQREWWVSVIQWTLWGVIMAAVMGWVARSRLRKQPDSERGVLRHPVSTLIIGLVCGGFFFGLAILSNTVGKNETTSVWTTVLFVGFGLMSVPMLADYFLGRHVVSDAGIRYGRMFGQRGFLNWSDVRRVRYSSGMKWFILRSKAGASVRISAMLMGLPEFARLVLQHVPPDCIDSDAATVLDETRNGRPPKIWG